MESPAVPPSQPATDSTASPPAEAVAQREEREKEMVYRTKPVQFLGRTTPIILQNDNGPCPLLAICNVLSLKNNLNLSPDFPEVSQEKLLSLVAERLIDSNSNIDNKDSGYVENQQQNISDAIDLLPRLTTGIDVNLKFRRIDDFEFTPECAIFDLLDIPLYHGWIVDPQDHETAEAIGSKSYNTLMAELVSLDTHVEGEHKKNPEDDDAVDFVAATTAALGVPSPCLSRGQSFDDSPSKVLKGDIEEEAELLRALKLSEVGSSNIPDKADVNLHLSVHTNKSELAAHSESVERNVTSETVQSGTIMFTDNNALSNRQLDTRTADVGSLEVTSSPSEDSRESTSIPPSYDEPIKFVDPAVIDVETDKEKVQSVYLGHEHDEHQHNGYTIASGSGEPRDHQDVSKTTEATSTLNAAAGSDPSSAQLHHNDEPKIFSSSIEGNEPIYEGEECILDSRTVVYENREPIYEGEVVLAEQVDKDLMDVGGLDSQDKLSTKKGEIIRIFMKTSASQLTIYGLFCLQDKVKERELCVFFRNNHFNTMFKYEGQLYILATDQGYSNQPDLVWEKLNEVNGDTVYMTSNFKEFKMDDHSTSTWDEQNAMASTADYLASIDGTQSDSNFNSDLQLAMALQQQEFEQQQQQPQQQQQNTPQPAVPVGASKMVTGPQVPRSSGKYAGSSSRPDSKSKEKCTIM